MNADELEALTASIYRAADLGRVELGDAERLREAVHSASTDEASLGRGHAVRGAAMLVAFKLSTRRADLDEAVGHLERAMAVEPTPSRAANLAAALLERSDLDGASEDHQRAVTLLRESLSDPAASSSKRLTRGTMLLAAFVDALERGFDGVPLGAAIEFGEQLVAEAADGTANFREPWNLLGNAYHLAAQRGHPRTDLERMVELLDHAVRVLPPGHPARPMRLSNLGAALLDRYEILGNAADLERAFTLNRSAYEAFPDGDPSKRLALNNFVNALLAGYERTGRIADIEAVLPLARRLGSAFAAGHPLHPVGLANAGLVVRVASQALDAPALIDEAVGLQQLAVRATPPGDPALPGRMASLALALSDRYHRDQTPGDLQEAIALGERSLATSASHDVERVGFESNLANLYHDRYLRFGRMSDLVRAATLHEQGLERLPEGHHDRAPLCNNAGIVNHELYQRLGDPAHLERAASYLAESVKSTDSHAPDYAARLANLASIEHSQAAFGDSATRLAQATALAERAIALAVDTRTRAIATGLLSAILRERWRRTRAPDLLERLAQLDSAAAASKTPASHLRRAVTASLTVIAQQRSAT